MSQHRKRLLARIVAPATEPVTLAEAKLYLRVSGNTEDALIGEMIVSSRMAAEEFLKRSLVTQRWKLAYDDYLEPEVWLPRGPVSSLISLTRYDRQGNASVMDSAAYFINAAKDTLTLDGSVFAFRVEIVYETGYGGAGDVPAPIKQGMLAHIAAMYDGRGTEGALCEASMKHYLPFREVML